MHAPPPGPAPSLSRRLWVCALAVLGLALLIELVTRDGFHGVGSSTPSTPLGATLGPELILVPAPGGLTVGMMARSGAPTIRGRGIPDPLERVRFHRSRTGPRIAILKPLSTTISIGTGRRFGAERPIIATSVASFTACRARALRDADLITGALDWISSGADGSAHPGDPRVDDRGAITDFVTRRDPARDREHVLSALVKVAPVVVCKSEPLRLAADLTVHHPVGRLPAVDTSGVLTRNNVVRVHEDRRHAAAVAARAIVIHLPRRSALA